MNTPVYVRKEAQDQLLLSEGLITYHARAEPFQLLKDPHGSSTDERVAIVRVHLVQSVNMLPHQSLVVPVLLFRSRRMHITVVKMCYW